MDRQMVTETDTDRAEGQAKAQLASSIEMVKALGEADNDDDAEKREEAVLEIHEDPLSVEVRSEWHSPGTEAEDEEYRILLCTGGPAVQLVGELGAFGEPDTADIQYQDWFTSWESLPTDSAEEEAMLTYARQFYLGG